MATSRRVFDKEFKLQVLRELQAGATVAELARQHLTGPSITKKAIQRLEALARETGGKR